MSKFCPHCGEAAHSEEAAICPKTGLPLQKTPTITHNRKNKVVAGYLAIFGGFLGVHKFYHGSWGWGLVYLALLSTLGMSLTYCAIQNNRVSSLEKMVLDDAKYYVTHHFTENESEILKDYLGNMYMSSKKPKGYIWSDNWVNTKTGEKTSREELDRLKNILDNLAETGARQSPMYEKFREFYDGGFYSDFGEGSAVLMLLLGIFLEIIGIIEGILYWRMSEEKYNAKYNETPSEVFKW